VCPLPYPEAIHLFKQVIGAKAGDGFAKMIFPDYVEVFGLDHLEISLDALRHFTRYASGEFAIRPFILQYGQPVIDRMLAWTEDDSYHVRRLASEGCRPRLPWAMALPAFKKDPRPILPILEKLKADPEDFVRRSVANNLNDISKDNPGIALGLAKKWKGQREETDWIVKHGCRTLLKQGVTEALILFAFEDPALVDVSNLSINITPLSIGQETNFSFVIDNKDQHPALLRLEYSIDYVKKTGKTSRKIFQVTEKTFPPGTTAMQRKLSFQNLSTRTHYPGEHLLRIIANGQEKACLTFELTES
jgi:3-methyladenine DNA glycosylase AlkC